MQPLRRNLGRYCGERIEIDDVLQAVHIAADSCGWKQSDLNCDNGLKLSVLHRKGRSPGRRIYISTGIHGDEPAGPMSVLRLLQENLWPEDCEIWLCPCLNPTGFPLNTRENRDGVDLNRDFKNRSTSEIRALTDWLSDLPCFDMGIHLHEDWESVGFYLFELNPKDFAARSAQVISEVGKVCPIDRSSEIEDFAATDGIIHPNVNPESRTDWPEAFFMVQEKTNISYTLEGPSDFPLAVRVDALCAAVNCLLV